MLAVQWQYRSFILGLVARDFRSQYLNSVLGAAWAVLNPLAQIAVYTLVFSQVMASRLAGIDNTFGYSIFLCAGLLPWQYFVEVLSRSQHVFVEQGNLMKKVAFPRSTLPVYVLVSASVNFSITAALFLTFLAVSGNWPGWVVLAALPLLMLQQALALGLGVLFGTLNVFFRDVAHVVGIVMQFWFWLTPVVYPLKAIPAGYQWIMLANPMLPVVQGYQQIFLERALPAWPTLAAPLGWALVALGAGVFAFKALGAEMVDEL